jgi:hypothetical protein
MKVVSSEKIQKSNALSVEYLKLKEEKKKWEWIVDNQKSIEQIQTDQCGNLSFFLINETSEELGVYLELKNTQKPSIDLRHLLEVIGFTFEFVWVNTNEGILK